MGETRRIFLGGLVAAALGAVSVYAAASCYTRNQESISDKVDYYPGRVLDRRIIPGPEQENIYRVFIKYGD